MLYDVRNRSKNLVSLHCCLDSISNFNIMLFTNEDRKLFICKERRIIEKNRSKRHFDHRRLVILVIF